MKLATLRNSDGQQRLGALCGSGEMLDLATSATLSGDDPAPFASMQSLIEAGETALATARGLVAAAPAKAKVPMTGLELLAPLPIPVQIRDCLSFEQHLKNCAESIIKMRAAQTPDPAAAEAEIRASGRFAIPEVWYKQPIYYKGNRFAVSGPDTDINWPSYSQIMDFELEIACVIGRKGRDIAAADADSYLWLHHFQRLLRARCAGAGAGRFVGSGQG
jgi:2-keto-4-pentenoate hydratase/2-oxohepta-3-ene-1,7-dioic acid hydratase in catechol pathway